MRFNVPLADDDAFDDRFDDLAAFLGGQRRPAGVGIAGLGQDLVAGEELDLLEVELALEARQLVFDLLEALLNRAVLASDALDRDLVGDVLLLDVFSPHRRSRCPGSQDPRIEPCPIPRDAVPTAVFDF